MEHTVIILGAGASAHTGAPVMAWFLDAARDIHRNGTTHDRGAFDRVFDGISELQLAQSKAKLDLANIESVFAAFEMAHLFEQLGELSKEHVQQLRESMRRVITETLSATITFPVEGVHIMPSPIYQRFVTMLDALREKQHELALITFNYDVSLDYALSWSTQFEPDYGFGTVDRPDRIPLLKLHGSLNWAACSTCAAAQRQHLHARPLQELIGGRPVLQGATGINLPAMSSFECPYDGEHCSVCPFIIPPTWNKGDYYSSIAPVWRAAAHYLHKAENIIVIGYSWPRTDPFFHLLYALGTAGRTILRRLVLLDPQAEVAQRYRGMLGEQAAGRFRHVQRVFDQTGIQHIAAHLGVQLPPA